MLESCVWRCGIKDTIESAFEIFVEQKRKDTLNVAVSEMAGWGSSMLELKMMTQPARKAGKAEVLSMVAKTGQQSSQQHITIPEGRRGVKCRFAGSLGCTGMHPPHRCSIFGDLTPRKSEFYTRQWHVPYLPEAWSRPGLL